nr:Unknown Function [uncultured bacterium]AIA11399.1 hypothetical protein [uncultured bacterium]
MFLLFRVIIRVRQKVVTLANGDPAVLGWGYRAPGGAYSIAQDGDTLIARVHNQWGDTIEELDITETGTYLITPFDSHKLNHEVDEQLATQVRALLFELQGKLARGVTFESDIRPLGGVDMPVTHPLDPEPDARLTDGTWTEEHPPIKKATYAVHAWRRSNDTLEGVRVWVGRNCDLKKLRTSLLTLAK